MADKELTPEAWGILQALAFLGTIRIYDASVEKELVKAGFVEKLKARLVINESGRNAAKKHRKREIKRYRKKS